MPINTIKMILFVTVTTMKQIIAPKNTNKEIMNDIDFFFDILSQIFF